VLSRFYPYRELNTFQDRVNRLFHESFTGSEGRDESLATSTFAPAVDVYEDEHNVTLKIDAGFGLASALGGGRLAMANPDSVPAGRYGRSALEALGVWSSVETRIARTENVRAALALVARGEAPLGIVYRTDALAEKGVRVVDTFPASTHRPILYPAAVVATAQAPAARSLLDYLHSPAVASIWEKYGYDLDVSFVRAQTPFTNKTVKVNSGSFQGYSMGPGYWGKTFFIWPPDPRFDITANPKFHSPLIKAHQEGTLVADLGRPGAYRYACVAAHSTVKKGIFTIRKT